MQRNTAHYSHCCWCVTKAAITIGQTLLLSYMDDCEAMAVRTARKQSGIERHCL